MNQPDIEIYIKQTNAEQIMSWLSEHFTQVNFSNLDDNALDKGIMLKGKVVNNDPIPTVITPKAAGKAYTSVWFQSDKTPWKNDLECAQSFIQQHNCEVRCSASTWTEEEAENEEKWWCLKEGQKTLVRWG